jgi:hypothetical protein
MPFVTKPQFTETNLIDGWPNFQSRNGQKPRYAVLHTTEGAGGMDLVNYMRGAEVSYHYVIGNDGQVYDLVDTDDASWSCLNANGYTINYVFGPSFSNWSAQQWFDNMGARGIVTMAWLVAADLVKYNIPPITSFGPNYTPIPSGVVDHRYFTKVVQDGNTHGDVGDGWATRVNGQPSPAEVFTSYLTTFYNSIKGGPVAQPPTPGPHPVGPFADQLDLRWLCLGGQTVVEAIAEIRDHVLGTTDRTKTGAL